MASSRQPWTEISPFHRTTEYAKSINTISTEAMSSLDLLSSSFGLTTVATLELLIFSAEDAAINTAKSLPNGKACYLAKELKFSSKQQSSVMRSDVPNPT